MGERLLPEQFAELESFVHDWALPFESQRNARRISSSFEELKRFYAAILPRMDEVVEFLNRHPLDAMPEDAQRLFHMSLSLMEIALPVEVLGAPNMPDSVEDSRLEFMSEKKKRAVGRGAR